MALPGSPTLPLCCLLLAASHPRQRQDRPVYLLQLHPNKTTAASAQSTHLLKWPSGQTLQKTPLVQHSAVMAADRRHEEAHRPLQLNCFRIWGCWFGWRWGLNDWEQAGTRVKRMQHWFKALTFVWRWCGNAGEQTGSGRRADSFVVTNLRVTALVRRALLTVLPLSDDPCPTYCLLSLIRLNIKAHLTEPRPLKNYESSGERCIMLKRHFTWGHSSLPDNRSEQEKPHTIGR